MLLKSINKIRASLTVRIFFVTTLIILSACLITYCFLTWATPISYDTIMGTEVVENVEKLVGKLSKVTLDESGKIIDEFLRENNIEMAILDDEENVVNIPFSELYQQRIIYDMTDTVEADSNSVITEDSSDTAVSSEIGVITYITATEDISIEFTFLDSGAYMLVVMPETMPVNHTVEAMQSVLPALILVILIISVLGALFYSRYITRPVVRLSGLSQKMTELDFSCRSAESRADEIGVLGRNLDNLSDNLSTALEQLREANHQLQKDMRQRTEFFAAASHELKTPLTILSGQLTGMLEGIGIYQDHEKYLPRSLAVVRRMEKLVGELLVISRMEQNGGELKSEQIQLSRLIECQIEDIRELALLRLQQLEAVIDQDIQVTGDKALMQRVVSNLLSNAVMHSPEQARITVLLEGNKLIVRNTGVLIPEEDLPHLFEPLYRVDRSRNSRTGGSGMGLHFVKMVLERHGASCMINNTEAGVEAVVEFAHFSTQTTN